MCAKGSKRETSNISMDYPLSHDSSVSNDLSIETGNSEDNTQEIVIRPKLPVVRGTTHNRSYEIDKKREGDVAKEKIVEDRIKQLGLWDNKRVLEQVLLEKLKADIDQDNLFQAINRCKRRRPLRDRVASVTEEIINIVQSKIVKDSCGNNVLYKVNIIMGRYTHNVLHQVRGHEVLIQGSTPENRGARLKKEIRIQFPKNINMSGFTAVFNAGVFKCEAPFKVHDNRLRSRSLGSLSSYSEDSSFSSDLKSPDLPGLCGHF